MEIRQLNTFKVLATTLNFTRTAEILNYVQSNVTAQIQALESELGTPLFERLGRRVMLTDAGRKFLRYTERILSLTEEARGVLHTSAEISGTLCLGASETPCAYRVPHILQQFKARYPEVRIQFKPYGCQEMRRAVIEGALDAAFVLEETFQSQTLVVEPLIQEPILLVAAPSHPLAQAEAIYPEHLADVTFLATERGGSYRNIFDRLLVEHDVYPANLLEFYSIEGIKQWAIADLGIAILPAVVVEKPLAEGKLIPLPWQGEPINVFTQLIWHKDSAQSAALNALLEVAKEVLMPEREVV